MASSTELVVAYVRLLGEGTSVFRPTKAELAGANEYMLLATDNYDPRDEEWEFLPGTTVRCELRNLGGKLVLVASARTEEREDPAREPNER